MEVNAVASAGDQRDNRGVAPLKTEFIIQRNSNNEIEESPSAPVKSGTGQNKNRQFNFQASSELNLCNRVANGEECTNENCKRTHDLQAYLASKEPELTGECPMFTQYGKCIAGARCRLFASHQSNGGETTQQELSAQPPAEHVDACGAVYMHGVTNRLGGDVVNELRKRTYKFPLTQSVMAAKGRQTEQPATKDEPVVIGAVCDTLERGQRRKIDWRGKTYLAPLTTVGNLPFRRVCKDLGVHITCGEMAMGDQILKGNFSELALLKRHESEDLFGVQLCGGNQELMAKCVEMLSQEISVDFIDVNLGCPIDMVYQKGWGSGLIGRPPRLRSLLENIVQVSHGVPITAKMRTGVFEGKPVAHDLLPMFQECGIDMVTLHGRSRQQRYTRLADWNYIGECSQVAGRLGMPFFGNGDILSYEEYYGMLEQYPTMDGVMIGRGALIKPWIFTEIAERRHWDIRSSERLDILKKFCNYGLTHWGSDCEGVNKTRRFLLEWLSFLYRYIPVGLLEVLPQRINERPPRYRGRDDLETLMASGNVQDWIQISEMLLGKTPDGFNFLPKHKSNAYESG